MNVASLSTHLLCVSDWRVSKFHIIYSPFPPFAVSPESALFDDKIKGVAQADHKECTYYYRHVLG